MVTFAKRVEAVIGLFLDRGSIPLASTIYFSLHGIHAPKTLNFKQSE